MNFWPASFSIIFYVAQSVLGAWLDSPRPLRQPVNSLVDPHSASEHSACVPALSQLSLSGIASSPAIFYASSLTT
ncbi:hypothetical protein BDV95DRAFT_142524 [Massariosphaeria phaeospora]|uniref:Secreted protein n=1 Tax=Massariosphaeria phaeospora TaxID=100035 RepID=A0A7C8IPM8_9PLEO|nr:hypothetical protein BDV95DRAFT_142524 [Massariosphaeria phaeospora]